MTPSESHFPLSVREGDVIAGKYHVLRFLGSGGMGTVVAARHLQLDELVAVKLLHSSTLEESGAVARFSREARAAVKIKSEHVARVFDVGTLESGAPYMVMEYLEGEDLARWLETRGPLSIALAITFVLQACEAIAEAHTLGIVHRDLKPANLFVVRKPDGAFCVKVLDFGVSKFTSPAATHPNPALTSTMALVGSPLYVAPEQLREARGVDARADIWALGVICFQLLSNETPFQGVSMPDLLVKIATAPARSLCELRRDIPAGLEAVILKCLEKDREKRPSDVGQFALSLLPYAPESARVSVERTVRTLAAASGVKSLSAPEPDGQRTAPPWGRTLASTSSKASLAVASAAVLLAGGAIALALTRGRAKPALEAADAGGSTAAKPADVFPLPPAPREAPQIGDQAAGASAPTPTPSGSVLPPPTHITHFPRQKKPRPTPADSGDRTLGPAPEAAAPPSAELPPLRVPDDPYGSAGRSPYDDRK